jgi:hypothetical protein
MKDTAYFWSKDAEVILAPYVQLLVGAEKPPTISSPISATPWDYSFNDDLLVDLKLACKARVYGRISDQTLADIRKSLENGVLVAVLIPPKLYLLFPSDITWDGTLEALWNRPSVLVPKNVLERVWNIYSRMTTN